MKTSPTKLLQAIRREVAILFKDVDILLIVLVSPLFYALFYGTVYVHKVETDIPVIVIDQDNSALSRKLIRSLDASQNLLVVRVTQDAVEAKSAIEDWQTQGAIWIPADFSKTLKSGRQAHLKVYLNTSRFLPSNDINRAVQQTVATLAAGVRLRYFQARGLNFDQATEQIQPLRVDDRNLFNVRQSYGDFLIPGVLALILQQTLLFGLAMSVAREFELNSFEEWQKTSKDNTLLMFTGKGIFYFTLYLAYSLFFFSVIYGVLHLPFHGRYGTFLLLTALFLLNVTLWGMIIGSFFRSKIVALQTLVFSSYPLFLLSGFSWPLQSMPWWIKNLSTLLPSTSYFLAMQRVTAMNAGPADIVPELLHLLLLFVLSTGLAYWRFQYLQKSVPLGASVRV
ncbi:ABC transporter permease [Caldithrix abyssi]